jgi:dolichol-phosphate mannosyltransferase
MQAPRPDLCIVVPAYNEEANLPLLLDELNAVLHAEGIKFDVLFVDDGSRDRTAHVIRELVSIHKNVRALMLSRNFGHQAAISTGLVYAKGNAIAIMDADLQDRPSDLLQLYRKYLEGADVVYAIRRSRPEGMPKRAIYAAFYRLVSRVATIQMPVDSGDFCVMSPAFVERLNQLPEKSRYVRGLRAWLGGRQTGVPVDRGVRRTGHTNYTATKLLRLAFDGLTSFS